MRLRRKAPGTLKKKAKGGFRGYPIATVAYYGPDNQFASKVAVGIVNDESGDVVALERWFAEESDVRLDASIDKQIMAFIREKGVSSVVLSDGNMGCPHEERVDYPAGENCPRCPYWANRNRFAGEVQ